jgi:hypothetical protein
MRDLLQARPVEVNEVDLRLSVVQLEIRAEEDPPAIGRPIGMVARDETRWRHRTDSAAVDVRDEDRTIAFEAPISTKTRWLPSGENCGSLRSYVLVARATVFFFPLVRSAMTRSNFGPFPRARSRSPRVHPRPPRRHRARCSAQVVPGGPRSSPVVSSMLYQ